MKGDGLFILPQTAHDWFVLSIFLLGTTISIIYSKKINVIKKQNFQETLLTICIAMFLTNALYELIIYKNYKIEILYIPFGFTIIFSKKLVDWIFLSKEGNQLLISTFKEIWTSLIKFFAGKAGLTINNDKNENIN